MYGTKVRMYGTYLDGLRHDHPLVIGQMSSYGCKGVRVEDLDGQNILVNLKISFSNKRFVYPKKGHSRRQCVRLGFIQRNNIGPFHCLRKNFVVGCTPKDRLWSCTSTKRGKKVREGTGGVAHTHYNQLTPTPWARLLLSYCSCCEERQEGPKNLQTGPQMTMNASWRA